MFCQKCGNELRDGASFCTKCGNQITPVTPVDITPIEVVPVEPVTPQQPVTPAEPVTPQQPVTPAQPVTPVEPVTPQQPVTPAQPVTPVEPVTPQQPVIPDIPLEYDEPVDLTKNNSNMGQQPYAQQNPNAQQFSYGAMQPTYAPAPKKKTGWIVLAVAAVLVALLGVGGYFMWPTIQMMINPEEQAKAALKTSTVKLHDNIIEAFNSDDIASNKLPEKSEVTYIVNLDKVTVDGSDYLSYLKAKTVKIDIQCSTKEKILAGSIGIMSDESASAPALELKYYMDSSNMYMRIPGLFDESFAIPTKTVFEDSGITYDDLFMALGSDSYSSANISQYMGIIEPVVNDVFKSIDVLVDSMAYEKIGKVELNGAQGSVKATQFKVVVTEQNVKDFAKAVVNNLYEDESLKAMLSLLTTGAITKDKMLQQIDKAQLGFGQMAFFMYINNNREIVRVSMDSQDIQSYLGDSFKVDLQFLGKESIYDSLKMNVEADESKIGFEVSVSGNNSKLALDIEGKQKSSRKYSSSSDTVKAHMEIDMTATDDGKQFKLNNLAVSGSGMGTSFDFAMSGSMGVEEISSVKIAKSDFPNAINVEKMTSSQEVAITSELIKNISVLKNVINDETYDKLYKMMFGLSSTIPLY